MIFVVEICPICGHDLQHEMIYTYPPIHVRVCYNCGWRNGESTQVKRVTFTESKNKSNEKKEGNF